MNTLPMTLEPQDLEALRWATQHLEHPSLAARLSSVIGTPVEIVAKLLPRRVYKRMHAWADAAIAKTLEVAVSSLRHAHEADSHDGLYRTLAASAGAVGGLFGLYGLLLDLPVSTTIMLRAIAEIARAEGEDIHALDTQMACLEVFALGGHAEADDAAETGYYGIRLALAVPVTTATHFIARHGLADAEAPLLVNLIRAISARFGASLSQKTAAQLVPLVGAIGGAAINVIFMIHFQEMARGHFVVRRLERKYGRALVQSHYERFCRAG